jgi:organic radical activating enzyme
MTLNELVRELNTRNCGIVLFGTGSMARLAAAEPGLGSLIRYCVDNDERKQGKGIELNGVNYEIKAPETAASEQDWSTNVVLIASSYFDTIQKQCAETMPRAKVYVYPLIRQNYESERDKWQRRVLDECAAEYASVAEQYALPPVNFDAATLVIPRVMIMPTTRCNLRCEGCSSLLPQFANPSDVSFERVSADLSAFFAAVDGCVRLTVGGEPFLYPHLDRLLELLLTESKLLGVMLITNGTIVPNDRVLELLRDRKVLVELSDYGDLERMSRVVTAFERSATRFKVLTGQVWDDFGGTNKRGRTTAELRQSYLNCEQSRLIKAIYNGKFYTCARAARMDALGVYGSDIDNCALNDDTECLRQRITTMYASETADACDYCDLGTFPLRRIPAGTQINAVRGKSEYTLVKRDELERLRYTAELSK